MTEQNQAEPSPKNSETDPPAANGPVEPGDGAAAEPGESPDPKGPNANEPSLSRTNTVPEVMQVPPGKPDGEVDTAG